MKRYLGFLGLALASFTTLHASIAPLPTNYVTAPGGRAFVSAGYWLPGSQNVDQGGAFDAWVAAPGTSTLYAAPAAETAFWCVDGQLYFNPIQTGWASITPLLSITADDPYVRYGNVHNSGGLHWTNTPTTTGLALPDSAQARFEMTAYLVSQYGGFTPFTSITGDLARNKAIQNAIWALTNNNSPSAEDLSAPFAISGNIADDHTTAYWIDQALKNYQSLNFHQWAIVSWQVGADGTPITIANYNTGARQTFLVYVNNPEPGFYGMLALAMSGVVMAVRRKKKTAKA